MVSAIEENSLYAGTMTVTGTVRTAPGARTQVSTPGMIGDAWTGASREIGGLVTTSLRMSVRSAACHVRLGVNDPPRSDWSVIASGEPSKLSRLGGCTVRHLFSGREGSHGAFWASRRGPLASCPPCGLHD